VATILELYLRDLAIRGELRNETNRRVVDLLNESAASVIGLSEAWFRSVHVQAPPNKLGTVRISRTQVLFVIPHDTAPPGPRRLRSGFVEKRPRPVAVGVGPYFVSGTFHVGPFDPPSLEVTGNETGDRSFVPITRARVTSQYHAGWSLDAGVILVNRAAISYSGSFSTP